MKANDDGLEDFIKEVLTIAGFTTSKTNIVGATPSAKKALKEGVPKEDILKAAEAVNKAKSDEEHKRFRSIRSPFQSTAYWMNLYPDESQAVKGVW